MLVGGTHESGIAALVGAGRPSGGINGGEEKQIASGDECLILGAELRAAQALLDAVGEALGVEAALQGTMRLIVELGHGLPLLPRSDSAVSRRTGWKWCYPPRA